MTERIMAEVVREEIGSCTTRQIGTLAVVYPIPEILGLRAVANELRSIPG